MLRTTSIPDPTNWAANLFESNPLCLTDFDLFESEIKKFYGDPEERRKAEQSLWAAEQKQGEGIRQFDQRFKALFKEAGFPSLNEKVPMEQVYHFALRNAMDPALHRQARAASIAKDGSFISTEELIEKAALMENTGFGRPGKGTVAASAAVTGTADGAATSSKTQKEGKRGRKREHKERQEQSVDDNSKTVISRDRLGRSLPPAPWISKELFQVRNDSHHCIRCGSASHRAGRCDKFGKNISGPPEPSASTRGFNGTKKIRTAPQEGNTGNQSKN